jgi:hypothetical protein
LAALLNVAAGAWQAGRPVRRHALAFSILSHGVVVVEFILGREFIDSLFPHQRSVNVIGRLRRPDTQVVKRLLIVSGHHDSAWKTLVSLPGLWGHFPVGHLVGRAARSAAVCLVQLAGLVAGEAGLVSAGTLGWILLAYPVAPAACTPPSSTGDGRGGGNVPGRPYLYRLRPGGDHEPVLAHLTLPATRRNEIRFITFGAEEAGLRGSRRYVARHLTS